MTPIIIVEGKYDKIKLESLTDGIVVATDGFAIFKDRTAQQSLKRLAAENGAIILTDSDRAGFKIRKYLHDILQTCTLYDLYIPDIYGKEKRKNAPSAEGKLGVEGIPADLLREILNGYRVTTKRADPIKETDLYDLGFYGREGSAGLRRSFQEFLGLPGRMNKNMLLKVLNEWFTKEQFFQQVSYFNEKISS